MTEPYRIRGAETWEVARLAYLDGFSADEVCARFDLGISALRKRAKLRGWRLGSPKWLSEISPSPAKRGGRASQAPQPPARLNALGTGRPIFSPIQRAVRISASRS